MTEKSVGCTYPRTSGGEYTQGQQDKIATAAYKLFPEQIIASILEAENRAAQAASDAENSAHSGDIASAESAANEAARSASKAASLAGVIATVASNSSHLAIARSAVKNAAISASDAARATSRAVDIARSKKAVEDDVKKLEAARDKVRIATGIAANVAIKIWDGTKPSLPEGGKPRGEREEIEPSTPKDNKRGLLRQHESADLFAQKGYDTEEIDSKGSQVTAPDYQIEGKRFDNYAPKSARLSTIRTEVSDKIKEGQTDRIILNMNDSPLTLRETQALFNRRSISKMKELFFVRDGIIFPVFLSEEN